MTALPEPRQQMTTAQFLASLDQNNSSIDRVREIFEEYDFCIMRIYRKDSSLHDIVMGSLSPYRLPIIDKPLQIVIEAKDGHQFLTGALFCYHHAGGAPPNNDPEIYDHRIWGQLYYQRGYGYYFTGAYGRTRDVVMSEGYRPDRFDKDLLMAVGHGS